MRETILRLHKELGLTILLSSHLLNEVEQLCTRIAVLNQGKKVFEGTMDATKQRDKWLRLKVGDFGLASKQLRDEQLVADTRDGEFVMLREGIGSEVIVRRLVELGMPVFEITPREQTLETFYLSLMNGE
jgi:ABC-2 type transport system ATP-binding protein